MSSDKECVNICFIGHVDAGKSTISGQLMYLSGNVDERTLEKYKQIAAEQNRDSWIYAYIMDTNEDERAKGKTIEVGRACFSTEKKIYTILDTPGHKNYVPNMISGTFEADIGILVISARSGEFETGFQKGGQTKEHIILAKSLGISSFIILVNKMDDSTVKWAKARYDEIVDEISIFLKRCGLKNSIFIPVSGLKGTNLFSVDAGWYSGKSLITVLDDLEPIKRSTDYPFRMTISDHCRDKGLVVIMGKIQTGLVEAEKILIVPNNTIVEVVSIEHESGMKLNQGKPGNVVKLYVKGVEENMIKQGFMLCSIKRPCPCVKNFEAEIMILEMSFFSAGYKAMLHIHSATVECVVAELLSLYDRKTGIKKKPLFAKEGKVQVILTLAQSTPMECFTNVSQLGRFTLRTNGKTIAIGKVLRLLTD